MQSFKLTHPVIGLDIGSRTVKMVQVRESVGGAQLLKFKLVELPLLSKKEEASQDLKENTINAIKESLRDFDTKLVKVISVVAGPRVSVRRVVMPPMPKREMLDAIRWESKDRLTFPVEEAIIDFQILGEVVEKGVKKYELVVVAVEKDLIQEHIYLLKKAGIKMSVITAAPLCLWNLVKKGITLPENKIVALINVGSEVTDINIFKGNSLQFTRQVLIGGMNITQAMTGVLVSDYGQIELDIHQAEEIKKKWGIPTEKEVQMIDNKFPNTQVSALIRPIIDRLISEIKRSFDYYREDSRGQRLDEVILVGGGSKLKGFKELLSRGLGMVVEIGEPLTNMSVKTDIEQASQIGSSLAVVVGAALGGTKGINLIPLEIRTRARKILTRLSVELVFTVVIFFMAFNYIFVYSQFINYRKRITSSNVELNTLQAQVRKASNLEQIRMDIIRRNSLIKELSNKRFDWVNLLKEMSNIVPKDIILTSISLEGNEGQVESTNSSETTEEIQEPPISGKLKILGIIPSKTRQTSQENTDTIAEFADNIENSDYFFEVNLISAIKEETRMKFEITCEIK